ncbi:hypothetical protein OG455_01195 [Kitasatospora sp. NBC_01287]|uniref:hypothetical protein n=1 Tax=Kitasatospora sp. NBC_01287 TaxID=2903573 RepID=UPI00225A65E5|nr:hypothetical protein [Kitasatospora sp. NBC_01287]MCX4744140.1 hypothetical protein [Kitasatospora sp. NBC_01287]
MSEQEPSGAGVFDPDAFRRATTELVPVRDRYWAAGARRAASCAVLFSALLAGADWGTGGLTPLRAGIWVALGWAVFVVLVPPRVSAGDGWLEVREPLRGRRVRTDQLVTVRRTGAIAVRLVLYDAHGGWVALDPRVLLANPLLWHRLDTAARRCERAGTLREGAQVLAELEERVAGARAREVLRRAGLG